MTLNKRCEGSHTEPVVRSGSHYPYQYCRACLSRFHVTRLSIPGKLIPVHNVGYADGHIPSKRQRVR